MHQEGERKKRYKVQVSVLHVCSPHTHTHTVQTDQTDISPMQIKQVVDSLDNNTLTENRLLSWMRWKTSKKEKKKKNVQVSFEMLMCLLWLQSHCLCVRHIRAQVLIETQSNHIWRLSAGKTAPEGSDFVWLQASCRLITLPY